MTKFRLRATVATRGEASAHVNSPGDAVLVERGRPRLLVLFCPCGCGEQYPINLDSRAGPAWRLYRHEKHGTSLFPSVWRESGCLSHFVIWSDKIYLFGAFEDDFEAQTEEQSQLIEAAKIRLPENELVSFSEIANEVDAVPWDVLMACRRLVGMGLAREGTGKKRGWFGRK